MTAEERDAMRCIRDLQTRLELAERRIAYLQRDKQMALERARKATDEARYWHGVALGRRAA